MAISKIVTNSVASGVTLTSPTITGATITVGKMIAMSMVFGF